MERGVYRCSGDAVPRVVQRQFVAVAIGLCGGAIRAIVRRDDDGARSILEDVDAGARRRVVHTAVSVSDAAGGVAG